MESFWNWLMRANARAVLIVAVIAFLLVTAWWTWREVRPEDEPPPLVPSAAASRSYADLGLQEYLEREAAAGGGPPLPPSPFRYPRSFRLVPPPVATNAPPPKVSPTPAPHKAPPKPEPVVLTYRGIFVRTDGQTVALLQDSLSGGSGFWSIGDDLGTIGPELAGAKISGITTAGVEVVTRDGASLFLTNINQQATFLKGKHAD